MNNEANEPLILSVETSSRIGSVAIACGEKLIEEITFSGQMRHSIELFPAIEGLLGQVHSRPCQIEQIYISGGPGSFTGLRIAVSIAKMMNLACKTKIVTVDTMDVIAANVDFGLDSREDEPADNIRPIKRIAAIIDAKRGQYFAAIYERHNAIKQCAFEKVVPDCVISASDFLEKYVQNNEPVWLLGDGLVYNKDKFDTQGVHFYDEKYWNPRAVNVHKLGWQKALRGDFTEATELSPLYLCRPQITIKK
jgi:tRNA threonylcarbamoyladenosine biosynthesis protein TsaB